MECVIEQNAQNLLVRLYNRRGPWFRVPQLSYPDIDNIPAVIQTLVTRNYFISCNETESHSSKPSDKGGCVVESSMDCWEIAELLTVRGYQVKYF
jgi:hypothetical protein